MPQVSFADAWGRDIAALEDEIRISDLIDFLSDDESDEETDDE